MDYILFLVCLFVTLGFAAGQSCSNPTYLTATSEVQSFPSHSAFGIHNYSNNQYSCWIIEATEDHVVMINTTAFDVGDADDCGFQHGDRVNVYDGESHFDDLLMTVCGDEGIWLVVTTQRYAYIEFITDHEGTGEGFNMAYIDFEDRTDAPDTENSDAGLIAVIVFGVIFGLAIIGGVTACIIACIVIAWNEKKTAGVRGVVHSSNEDNRRNHDSSTSPPDDGPQFFTGNRHAAAAGSGPIFSTAQSLTASETKTKPKGSDVVDADAARNAPPAYMPSGICRY